MVRDFRSTRGHEKVKKNVCRRDIKKNIFLQRTAGNWIELQKVVNAITIHYFKEKLDESRD